MFIIKKLLHRVFPTKIEQAFEFVQPDPRGVRNINTIVPLPSNPQDRERVMKTCERAVREFMGVSLRWDRAFGNEWAAHSPEAAPESPVRKNLFFS